MSEANSIDEDFEDHCEVSGCKQPIVHMTGDNHHVCETHRNITDEEYWRLYHDGVMRDADAFLEDYRAICKKHGMIITSEVVADYYPFVIYDGIIDKLEDNIDFLRRRTLMDNGGPELTREAWEEQE